MKQLCLCRLLLLSSLLLVFLAISTVIIVIRDAPIIGIRRLVRWYRPIVVYTVGKYKFLFLLPKVNKHESGFRFR